MASLSAHLLQVSDNALDSYHALGSAQLPGAPRFQYLTLRLNGATDLSRDSDEYCWRVSLWNSATQRVSRDLYLRTNEFDSLNVFELSPIKDSETDETFLYVDLVHRPSGVPIASGSQKITQPIRSPDDASSTTSSLRLSGQDEVGAFHLQKMLVELALCDNIKYYPTIPHLDYTTKNNAQCVRLSISVGNVLTNGRADVQDFAYDMPMEAVRLVPLFTPSLHDKLHHSVTPAGDTPIEPPAPITVYGNTLSSVDNNNGMGSSGARPAAALNACAWHVTVEDCQLTSDILDLYADRHILITAGSGGTASLAPHAYVGHILQYQGHYIEKAELSIIGSTTTANNNTTTSSSNNNTANPYSTATNLFSTINTTAADIINDNADVYKSCLNFEVKVMECADTTECYDYYNTSPTTNHTTPYNSKPSHANNSTTKNTTSNTAEVRIEQCVVCVGVLQHTHKITEHTIVPNDDNALSNILNPTTLTSGRYEVLLYNVYSPNTDLEVTLVGRIVVQLAVPELVLTLPQVPRSEPLPFDVARFQSKSGEGAFVYWAECVVRCCDNIVGVEDSIEHAMFNSISFDPTTTMNTTYTNATANATNARDLHKRRTELRTELQTLLCILTLPQYTEYSTHSAVVWWLCQCDSVRFRQRILPALHTFFQEWLASEVLSRLMLTPTTDDAIKSSPSNNNTVNNGATNYPTTPNTNALNVSANYNNYTATPNNPTTPTITNITPTSKTTTTPRTTLLSPRTSLHSPSPEKTRRSPAGPRKVVVVLPFDTLPEMDWLSLTSACACVRVLGVHHLDQQGGAQDGGGSGGSEHDSTSEMSNEDDVHSTPRVASELLDFATLCEISEDLLCALVKYAANILALYNAWAARNTDVQLAKFCAQECLRRLAVCVELMCLLVPTVAQLSASTEEALRQLTGDLLPLFGILANPRWEEEDEMWAATLHEQIVSFVRPLVQVLARYAVVQHRPAAPMALCLQSLCGCVDALQRSVLWRTEAHFDLLLTLTETATNMSARLSERVKKFEQEHDPAADNTADLFASTGPTGNAWSMREAMNRAPPPPTVDLPQSPRKGNRRGSVVNMFGVDVTAEPGGSTQTPNAVNVSFNPAVTTGPTVDEEARTQAVLQSDVYAEEALLHFVHENIAYFRAVESVLDTLQTLQRKSARKSRSKSPADGARQESVGVLTAFHALLTVLGDVLVGLCNGLVHVPDMVKFLIKSTTDSNGVPGRGLVLVIDLYSRLHRKYFDFIAANKALQHKITSQSQELLARSLQRVVTFHSTFLDILFDHARADKYMNRTVWLAHKCSADTGSTAAGRGSGSGGVNQATTSAVAAGENANINSVAAALSQSLSLTMSQLSHANNRNKRFDEYAAQGAVAVLKWLKVRQGVQDTLLSAAQCVVTLVQHWAARPVPPASAVTVATSPTSNKSNLAPNGVVRSVHAVFGEIVEQLCRTAMMGDLGLEGKDIVSAVVAETPLHKPLHQLWRLSESIPASLLEEVARSDGSVLHLNAPLHVLVNTILDLSKLNLELGSPGCMPGDLDSTVCAIAQLLEDLSMKNVQASKEGVLFHLKSILKCTLNSYLLVFEDPAWGAQPVILTKAGDGPGKITVSARSPFPDLFKDTLRQCTQESGLSVVLLYLQREYVLHTVSMKFVMCCKNALMYEDPLLRAAPVQCRLLRSMFEKSFLGGALGNMILYGMSFMDTTSARTVSENALDAPASNDNLFSMVEELAEIFRVVPNEKSRSAGQNSSELLSVFGCSFKAYHDLMRLLITHQQETFRVTSTKGAGAVQTLSEIARKLEIEIRQLRHCLQGLLRSGQWEVGIELANLYLEKYQKLSVAPPPRPPPPPPPAPSAQSLLMTPTRSAPKSPSNRDRAKSPGRIVVQPSTPRDTPGSPLPQHRFTYDDAGADLRPSSIRHAEEVSSSPLPPSSVNQSNAKRYEAIKSELHRVLDSLQNKINSNGDLRLFPHYYTVRFVSDTPWESGSEDAILQTALGGFQGECFQCASSAWVHRANSSTVVGAEAAVEEDTHPAVFEYWLVMKFDASAYPVCADYYEDVLSLDQQRRMGGGSGQDSDFSLLSPIAYHNIQAQLAMAFPAYTMLSAHQMMETYVGEGAFTDQHHLGSIKLMQLFQAFPADLCEDALSPAVLDALTAIKDAKSARQQVTAQRILDTESLDGLDFANEHKQDNTDTAHTTASGDHDTDLVTELKKHAFTELPATRFFAYSIMNDEQIQAMDSFNSHLEAIEKSAYIHRFELAVSESSLDFTQLKLTLQETAAATSTAYVTATPVVVDPVANLKNRFRSKSGASDAGGAAQLGGMSRKQSNNRLFDLLSGSGSGDVRDAPLPPLPNEPPPPADTANTVGAGDTKIMNVFSVSPVNLALHRNSTCCTPIQVSLEVLYCHMVQLRRAHAAMVKLNEFTRTELANEPLGDVSSSDSIFTGVFTLLSNLLTMPASTCMSFTNMETILISEQERIDLEWHAERKVKRRAHVEAVERYEEDKSRETKKWKKLMAPEPPPLDLKALELEFYSRPDHAHLKSLQTLHEEAQLLLYRTLEELRAFVMAKDDEVAAAPLTADDLRSIAIKRGRRPTVTSMMLHSSLAAHLSDSLESKEGSAASPPDTAKSLKLKLCLYLEALFASMEIGIPM